MKYWLLTTEYPPLFGGGIGTYCKQWCQTMKKNREQVTVFFPDSRVKDYTITTVDEIRFVRFSPYLKETSSFLGYDTMLNASFEAIIEIFLLEEGLPDWMEAQEYKGLAYFILQKKHLGYPLFKDLKVHVTIHAPSYLYFEYNYVNPSQLPYFWIGEMERFCIKAADVCIAPSQYIIDRIVERHPTIKRDVFILHNPYTNSVSDLSSESNINNDVAYIAKLSPSKGILNLLGYFDTLWKSGNTTKLNLIGDEAYFYHAKGCMMGAHIREKYGKYINDGLLTLTGNLPPSALQKELHKARVIVVPSLVDNFPYTVVEAMWEGKIVIASRQGGQVEIIEHGQNGFLFDHNHPETFFQSLDTIFSLSNDGVKKIGQAAHATVQIKCDPAKYLQSKFAILNHYQQSEIAKELFPFISINSELISAQKLTGENREKLLSIVIPYYNMRHFIQETVKSILASNYKNIEIIIVDDGSDDALSINHLNELHGYEAVKIIHQTNKGLAIARNTGAQAANGEYIAFLDADDRVHPSYYSKAVRILEEKQNVHFVGCWVQYFGHSSSIWPAFTPEPPYILIHNTLNSSALVYRRASFLSSGLNDPAFVFGMEDYDSVISMVENGKGGVVLPELLYFYRVRKDSMARGFNNSNMSYLYHLLCQKHIKLYTIFAAETNSLLNANGPGYRFDNPTLDYHLYLNSSFKGKMLRKIAARAKHYSFLRKVGLRIFRKLNS